MKKYTKVILTSVIFLVIAGTAGFLLIGPNQAEACGWGRAGGGDYVPQRRGSSGNIPQDTTITQDQAREIAASHVRKLNPSLAVGSVNDAGGFFEAEILSSDKEVLQLLGVDKFSGSVMLIN